jgi:site-specific DNA-methyltransferase (adenine-specific)
LYGSGFPKSLDVSKAIDKAAGAEREVTGTARGHVDSGGVHDDDNYEWKPIYERKDNPSTLQAQQWQGWGTALKPAFEPVIVARKPIEGTVANNVLKWGTGGLNIDGSRIASDITKDPNYRPNAKDHAGHGSSFSVGGQNTREKNDLPDAGFHNSAGRWPANIILDPYTAELLDEQSGTLKSGELKPGRNHAGNNVDFLKGISEHTWSGDASSGGASRFFYVAKASKRDRNEGLEKLEEQRHSDRELTDGVGGDNPRNRTNQAKQNFHPTVKPTSLMEYLVKLVTPPHGTVLDPFTGSGSTGKAAILQGFDFIGIEMTEEYLPIIEGRLKHAEAKVAERIKETADQEQEKLF